MGIVLVSRLWCSHRHSIIFSPTRTTAADRNELIQNLLSELPLFTVPDPGPTRLTAHSFQVFWALLRINFRACWNPKHSPLIAIVNGLAMDAVCVLRCSVSAAEGSVDRSNQISALAVPYGTKHSGVELLGQPLGNANKHTQFL